MQRLGIIKFLLPGLILLYNCQGVFSQRKETRVQYAAQISEVDKKIGRGAQRLLGDVVFTHEGSKMYCDSAYFYSKTNSLDAYNNIYINQGDTVFLYGDFLHYDGKSRLAEVTGRQVKLIDDETILTTTRLDYNLQNSLGYYMQYAHVVNQENTLESNIGYYYAKKETFHFSDSVKVTTPDYTIYSDTLKYHTKTGIATFLGPTDMIGDSSHIYCEKGWYDSKNEIAELEDNAWADNMKQLVKGDYILYNKASGEGFARHNVEITDKEKDIILTGNIARYNDSTEYAYMTDSAQFIQFSETDTLFLHADSLKTFPDTSGQKVLQAFKNARFYRQNVQGLSDSIVYTFVDSIARLYGNPVLWREQNQISAETIDLITKNQLIDKMILKRDAFISSKEDDTASFNQIKGKDMVCFFENSQLVKIEVDGNGQTIYYAKEDDEIVGVNKVECSRMIMHFKDNDVTHINFYQNPKGVLYPLDQAPENELILKGFEWKEALRPKNRYDIFK